MKKVGKAFFSHKQKNILLGLLACTTALSLLLAVMPGGSGNFALTLNKPKPSTASADNCEWARADLEASELDLLNALEAGSESFIVNLFRRQVEQAKNNLRSCAEDIRIIVE